MAVTATFNSSGITRHAQGVIHVPVVLSADATCSVEVLPRGTIRITPRSGQSDDLSRLDHTVYYQSDNNFIVAIQAPLGEQGGFHLDIAGIVFCRAMNLEDQVVSATGIDVAYDLREPTLVRDETPANYTPGERFDIIWEFNASITFDDPTEVFDSMDATYLDYFIFVGADLGVPNLYVYNETAFPTQPLPATLPAEWTQLSGTSPPARILLLRWDTVISSASGQFEVKLKPNSIRGPVV